MNRVVNYTTQMKRYDTNSYHRSPDKTHFQHLREVSRRASTHVLVTEDTEVSTVRGEMR
jgi:hypothetical protein